MQEITIKTHRLFGAHLSFDKDFKGGDLMGQTSVKPTLIQPPSVPDEAMLVIELSFSCESMNNEFKMTASLTAPYMIKPKTLITKKTYMECVGRAIKRLQMILDATFADQINVPQVAPISETDLDIDHQIRGIQ